MTVNVKTYHISLFKTLFWYLITSTPTAKKAPVVAFNLLVSRSVWRFPLSLLSPASLDISDMKLKLTYNLLINSNTLFETRWNLIGVQFVKLLFSNVRLRTIAKLFDFQSDVQFCLLGKSFGEFHYVRLPNPIEVNRTAGIIYWSSIGFDYRTFD